MEQLTSLPSGCVEETAQAADSTEYTAERRVSHSHGDVEGPPDCAATTLARRSPDAARLIRPILAHSNFLTAEQHYNHAQAIETGRDYAGLLSMLKKEA